MHRTDFEDYFREYKSNPVSAVEFETTHPEYLPAVQKRPLESIIVEALIWHTDFPYLKQKSSQERFTQLLNDLKSQGQNSEKLQLIAEILWLSDLSVTYMSSDPIRAWDRVSSLYDELNLPRVEAVSRTDAFFSDFAENELFKDLIRVRHFPEIFRQRWNMVYDFFHEGNPSTQLYKAISKARHSYTKINIEICMRHAEKLEEIATNNWAEFFIGIGNDQKEVLKAKSRFLDLNPSNAAAFWGESQKLLQNIAERSIDNFLLVLPSKLLPIDTIERKLSLGQLLSILPFKLVNEGTLQLLTDLENDDARLVDLINMVLDSGFHQIDRVDSTKTYFKADSKYPEFIEGKTPRILLFRPKNN
jgi:hypothetical protein